jgi:hypothetical protein
MRYKNVEFRQSNVADSNGYCSDQDRDCEIIAWEYSETFDKETCITICWLKPDKEGYYMKTIGDRYVEYEDMEALNHVTKYAMRSLAVQFEFEDRQSD